MENIRNVVKDFILEHILSEDDSQIMTDETQLKESGILDSLSTLKLVSFLEERFRVDFQASDLDDANFSSIVSIERLVNSKKCAR